MSAHDQHFDLSESSAASTISSELQDWPDTDSEVDMVTTSCTRHHAHIFVIVGWVKVLLPALAVGSTYPSMCRISITAVKCIGRRYAQVRQFSEMELFSNQCLLTHIAVGVGMTVGVFLNRFEVWVNGFRATLAYVISGD
jgi:hypothetical protein